MKFIIPTLFGFAAMAAADIFILAGDTNDVFGSGSGQNAYVINTAQTPNCDNLGSPRIIQDDASKWGAACDGCNLFQKYEDWVITRFELYDKPDAPVTKQHYGHLSEYPPVPTVPFCHLANNVREAAYLEDGNRYGLNADDGNGQRRIGRCERTQGATVRCVQGLTTDFFSLIMTCYGENEPLDADHQN